ncbi:MAG: TonB-dependent receptor [Flavobacteriales bacterium]|nr:TonB-dependent receptor [Flavobacteriales bacterium]
MKRLVYAIYLILCFSLRAFSQPDQGIPTNGKITGKILDALTKKPVEFTTITARHARDTSFFTGALADSKGEFLLDKLKPGKYYLTYSFIGYKTVKDTVVITPQQPEVSAGTILLEVDAKALEQVTIEEEKDNFQLAIDKKIFNVEKDLVSAGGSAIDVLKQVPTVNVDIDGKISLRGSENLMIFINGRPSGLTAQNREQILQQIPASNIDRIELITNPSAKYDAEGMSGIINIITKRNIADGMSGSITAGVGTYHKYNASATLNYRTEKLSTSNTLGFRYSRYMFGGYNNRTNLIDSVNSYTINQQNEGFTWDISPTFSGNIDFMPNTRNTIGLTYLFGYGNGIRPELIDYQFLNANDWVTRIYQRNTDTPNESYSADGGINYTLKLPKQNRELTASSSISFNRSSNRGNYIQQEFTLDNLPDTTRLPSLSHNIQYNQSIVSVTQMDYTHPFAKIYKFETGWKVNIRQFDNEMIADSFDYNQNNWIIDNGLTNRFIYLENVNAVYGTFSGSVKEKFGYQVGLRVEQTNVWGEQTIGNIAFTKNYVNFFPSVFLSYKAGKGNEFQLNYSRRINRPGLQSLNPFANYEDPLNIRKGNPDLNPENIDALEFNYSKQWKNHTLVATAYFRHVDGIIQRYRNVDSLGISTVTFINLDYSINFGVELVARNRWFKWWNSTSTVSVFRNQVFGQNQEGELNATNFSYNIRLQNSFKIGKNMEFQLSFNLNGPNVFPQGTMAEVWGLDAGYRLDFLKNKASLTLNVSDIFDTRRFYVDTRGINFYGDVYRKRETRVATIQFTYRFGKQQESNRRENRRRMQEGGEMEMGL